MPSTEETVLKMLKNSLKFSPVEYPKKTDAAPWGCFSVESIFFLMQFSFFFSFQRHRQHFICLKGFDMMAGISQIGYYRTKKEDETTTYYCSFYLQGYLSKSVNLPDTLSTTHKIIFIFGWTFFYRKVDGSIPLVFMSKRSWARYWTPNCSWWLVPCMAATALSVQVYVWITVSHFGQKSIC